MVLEFKTYKKLIIELQEYVEKNKIASLYPTYARQDEIFNHFTDKYGGFVAENINGDRMFFSNKETDKRNKSVRRLFRKFMNTPPSKQKLKSLNTPKAC